VQLLLGQGANIKEKEKKQYMPLCIAYKYGYKDTVWMLLTLDANIEAKLEFNYTPLYSIY
jgi:ankyrin repeat protein